MADLVDLYNQAQEKRKEFGLWLAHIREKSGHDSQRQLALASNVSPTTISRIEAGNQKAEPETLKKLAPFLRKTSFQELMTKAGYPVDLENLDSRIPLLGTIRAGLPILSEDNWEEQIDLPSDIKADFAARVEGDSMIYAGILPGDIAFFKQIQEAYSGQIVAARIIDMDSAVNLKFFVKKNGQLVLRSANPDYADIEFTQNHSIIGVMTGLIRDGAPAINDYERLLTLKDDVSRKWTNVVTAAIADGISPEQFAALVETMKKFLKQ